MKDRRKTKEQLIGELVELRQRIAELEASVVGHKRTEETLRQSRDYVDSIVNGMLDDVMVVDRSRKLVYVNDCFIQHYDLPREELIGRMCYEVTHRTSRPCSFDGCPCPLESVLTARSPVRLEHTHRDSKDQELVVALYAFPLLGTEREGDRVVVVAHDITTRTWVEAQTQRHAERIDALYAVAQTVSESLNMDEMLDSTLGKVVEVMAADTGNLYLLDVMEKVLLLKANKGMSFRSVRQLSTIRLDEEECQRLLHWRDPSVTLSGIYSETNLTLIANAMGEDRIESFAAVHISLRGEMRGVLGIGAGRRREFTSDDIDMLRAIGSEIAVGVENARLLERARELSITDELTGLYNRRHLYEVLDAEIQRIQRYGGSLSMAMLDLDGFKHTMIGMDTFQAMVS